MTSRPSLAYGLALDYFAKHKPKCISLAYREFVAAVDPDIDEDDYQAEEELRSLCLE